MCIYKKINLIALSLFMLMAINLRSQVTDNSVITSQNIPNYIKSGQVYPVSITFINTGLNTWYSGGSYKLSLLTNSDNVYQSDVWGVRHVSLSTNVTPQEKVTFNFDIAAPRENGTYNCNWSMAHNDNYFGDRTFTMIQVSEGENLPTNYSDVNNNSEYINQSIPSNMTPGLTYKVWVSMKNTGKTSWSSTFDNAPGPYRLGFVTDMLDGTKYMNLNSSPVSLSQSVDPGESATFEFEVTAPQQTGSYYFQTMMMQNNAYFGQKSNGVWVNVSGSGVGSAMNNSNFTSQKIPNKMASGREYKISVTMMNNGQSTWVPDKYTLSLVDSKALPISLNAWDVGYVSVPHEIPPGSSVTFTFNVKAPATANYYPMQFSLMESGRPFGNVTPAVNIQVVSK